MLIAHVVMHYFYTKPAVCVLFTCYLIILTAINWESGNLPAVLLIEVWNFLKAELESSGGMSHIMDFFIHCYYFLSCLQRYLNSAMPEVRGAVFLCPGLLIHLHPNLYGSRCVILVVSLPVLIINIMCLSHCSVTPGECLFCCFNITVLSDRTQLLPG